MWAGGHQQSNANAQQWWPMSYNYQYQTQPAGKHWNCFSFWDGITQVSQRLSCLCLEQVDFARTEGEAISHQTAATKISLISAVIILYLHQTKVLYPLIQE